MPYDIKMGVPSFNGSTVSVSMEITRDGQPYGDGGWNFHGTSKADFDEKSKEVMAFLSKQGKMTGLSYKEMHKFEKDGAKFILDWGDEHQKKGKGK